MPLSKARDKARKRLSRLEMRAVQPAVPLYNTAKHQPGDAVRVNGKVVTIPLLDADGQVIPEY